MPRLLIATFNIPCSGAGTFVLLVSNPTAGVTRQIYGIDVDSAGNQAQYTGAGEFSDISIAINNGIATVKVYMAAPTQGKPYFRCCFIPGNPFTEYSQ